MEKGLQGLMKSFDHVLDTFSKCECYKTYRKHLYFLYKTSCHKLNVLLYFLIAYKNILNKSRHREVSPCIARSIRVFLSRFQKIVWSFESFLIEDGI